jgi:hypothetical protein
MSSGASVKKKASRIVPRALRPHVTRLMGSEEAYTHNLNVLVSAYVKPMRLRANELACFRARLRNCFQTPSSKQ